MGMILNSENYCFAFQKNIFNLATIEEYLPLK